MIIHLASPPLPPPPPMENSDMANQMGNKSTIYGTSSSRQNVPDWAPAKFIEKGYFIFKNIENNLLNIVLNFSNCNL